MTYLANRVFLVEAAGIEPVVKIINIFLLNNVFLPNLQIFNVCKYVPAMVKNGGNYVKCELFFNFCMCMGHNALDYYLIINAILLIELTPHK